ncbi:ATP-binding cassette domain-containing protein [Methanosphaerula palustris]|uniref:ABC transporter related n=1 Tax=Methanosphaerula palustris (strain ATCC BAA-1556 / DSM 19958 / E1-9c) TaxID=521011 RepID=B8GGV5_METPE|nr:ATP-binding cassette domain-containing protein [Methanosphaerula palustris]ACL16360.1 ABC transporter related [Methanosphaerula palustris E1-9c]
MHLTLEKVVIRHEDWSLSCDATFTPGVHLITGRIGAGKSSLAEVMTGVAQPAEGRVRLDGIKKTMLSLQFPEYQITQRTLHAEATSWGIDPDLILAEARLTGLEQRDPLTLSRGEQKRLQLTCILASDHDLLVLDEPLSSLDCMEKERVCRRLGERQSRITILFTHEQWTFPRVDMIWEIRDHQLVCCGPVPEGIKTWQTAPPPVLMLLRAGVVPENLTPEDLKEAACRING